MANCIYLAFAKQHEAWTAEDEVQSQVFRLIYSTSLLYIKETLEDLGRDLMTKYTIQTIKQPLNQIIQVAMCKFLDNQARLPSRNDYESCKLCGTTAGETGAAYAHSPMHNA